MPQTDYSWGPAWDSHGDELLEARGEVTELRHQVNALEAEVDRLTVALCHATLHDGRGGRVGLPSIWRAWHGPAT